VEFAFSRFLGTALFPQNAGATHNTAVLATPLARVVSILPVRRTPERRIRPRKEAGSCQIRFLAAPTSVLLCCAVLRCAALYTALQKRRCVPTQRRQYLARTQVPPGPAEGVLCVRVRVQPVVQKGVMDVHAQEGRFASGGPFRCLHSACVTRRVLLQV
jgi:hypothetical protein